MPNDSYPRPSEILVTHPGRQHSHQLAVALQKADRLAAYWTGVPARPLLAAPLLRTIVSPLEKHPFLPIPDDRVRHNLISPLTRRMFEFVLPTANAVDWTHRSMDWFDSWCAEKLDDIDASAVVCYENAALHTFQAAKERGWTTVLDAASYHHAWQDQHYDYQEFDTAHERINDRKDREIDLADHILTVSALARDSYLDAGVNPAHVHSVPVGCDLETFDTSPSLKDRASTPFTFIFAGHASRRKGVDLLLNAASRLAEDDARVRFWFAGGADESLAWEAPPNVQRLGYLDRETLAERFQEADCLVLPSRHDSFGMVVVEAMATGLPAIVSENVGAKEAVTEGRSGWVVPADAAQPLYHRLRWCIDHPGTLREMESFAREDAEDYSWTAYHKRVLETLESII